MERILHFAWKNRLYSPDKLFTSDNIPIEVLDTGTENASAGPDFFNAKLKIGGISWVGNVVIHEKTSDWYKHKRHENQSCDPVILHIAGTIDADLRRSSGELIPQARLTLPEQIERNINRLLFRNTSLPCLPLIKDINPILTASWINALTGERLERKTADIFRLLSVHNNDWNEIFYITLARNFGFGLNGDAFEQLAESLPYRFILKHRDRLPQVESLLFGQAGMLEDDISCPYYRSLRQDYKLYRHKYGLRPLDSFLFRSMRARSFNFPHIKIAQLASILVKHDTLFSHIIENEKIDDIKSLFRIPLSEYWSRHYHFRGKNNKLTSGIIYDRSLDIIIVNTVVPTLFAYGRKTRQPGYSERAISFLESIPPENNQIITTFLKSGLTVKHAGDTQALIQLKREYCEKGKCLQCRIGVQFVRRMGNM
jgi:hypothetical protein